MLGRGGMGAVYMGRQTALDRPVAIKILSGALEEGDHGFTERFKNEARAMARLNHPGIVGVYDFGQTGTGLLYIVMEYVDGTDVAKMIAKDGRLHTEHAMAITAHVCDALAYAHERGIIHRDIKPANIMVGYDGVVKVADFGLAKVNTSGATSGLTQSNVVMGTLHYMAPEALMLGNAVDHRADIYAVGVMLYQMLTGKIPQGMFELPSLQVKGLDPRYDGIIAKALREDRDKRYGRAVELRHDLDAILTQPVVKVEEHASQAPAALNTQARPKRPGGAQPYRPPQPRQDYAPPPKKGSGAWVVVMLTLGVLAWFAWKQMSPLSPTLTPLFRESSSPAASSTSNATTTNPAEATKDRPFVNSLGMKFVPLPGTKVLFCIHEVRYKDYSVYAKENPAIDPTWKNQEHYGFKVRERFEDHPVVGISWEDAMAYCAWLSKKEGKVFRLPSDHEWSLAVGIKDEDSSLSPDAKSGKIAGYPWGVEYPPPRGAGNYSDLSRRSVSPLPAAGNIAAYEDGFVTTAPVMSFGANAFGLYDLGGNAREWVLDLFKPGGDRHVLRGCSWDRGNEDLLRSSRRDIPGIPYRMNDCGFRVVIEQSTASSEQSTASSLMPAPSPQANGAPLVPANSPKESSTDQGRGPIDVLALIDPVRDNLKGTWKKTTDGLSLVGDGNMQIPYSPAQEYDFEVEFSITSDSVGVVAQQIRFEGKPITWIMSGQAPGFKPRFGFGPVSGVSPNGESEVSVFSDVRFSKGVRYRSLVQVRKDSLTGLL
ncbi:MAG: bifunctional serine/threonine-protein kinase/formylglycine-generating enzyme family protein, partial [Prosthecobacter sp.]